MSRKKVESLLKGVAITGATVGGASVLGDANLAYAAELGEEEATANAQGVLTIEVTEQQAKEVVETTMEAAKEETEAQLNLEDSQLVNKDMESTTSEASESETSASESSESEASTSEASTSEASTSEASESESAQLSSELASELDSLSTAMSEADSEYAAASNSFEEAGLENEYLENLIHQIEQARVELKNAQNNAIRTGTWLNHDSKSNNYYGYGDKLANLLIQYSFYQEGIVGEILESTWNSSHYDTNSVKVTYLDAAGETKYAYFDYVTVDSDGNALVSGFYDSPERGSQHDNPYVVDGIMVVRKTAEYVNSNGEVLTWDYQTETAADGTETTVCHYYVNGRPVADNVHVTINEDGTFTAAWKYDQEAKVATVEEQSPGYESGIYKDANSETIYHDLSKWAPKYGDTNARFGGVCRSSAEGDNTLGIVKTDTETGATTISTLVTEDGKAIRLEKKSGFFGKYVALKIGDVEYDYGKSSITANSDGTYTLTALYDSFWSNLFNWYRDIKITLYTEESLPTYGNSFDHRFVSKANDGKDSYINAKNQSKDGNFGVKGYTYFTLDDFNKGRDDYHAQRSEVTSLSERASELASTSTSMSTSISESLSASLSTSLSESTRLSESISASESTAARLSEAMSVSEPTRLSESMSTSESTAASLSESMSISESTRLSESISASESTAASLSESTRLSESISASESTAASLSESMSISESTRLSESISASESTAASLSESMSLSESTRLSESISASESTAASMSESTRLSESISASESTAASLSESMSLSESASISESISASESESLVLESERLAKERAASNTYTENISYSSAALVATQVSDLETEVHTVVDAQVPAMGLDEQVPLAVKLDEEADFVEESTVAYAGMDSEQVKSDETITIADEEAPMAAGKTETSGKSWLYGGLGIGGTIAGMVTINRRKVKNKKIKDSDK